MQKYQIMGHEMIKLGDMCHAIRSLRKTVEIYPPDEQKVMLQAYDNVVRMIFLEDIKAAETPEEIDAILEMPGDFIVYKLGEHCPDVTYFAEWDDGKAITTKKAACCMHFTYESMAEHTAEKLGDGWKVMDASPEACADAKKLLNVIFADDETECKNEGV